ncbi:MAG: acetyl-CoA carboxylase biotin carboxyl carrier protein subunit [Alphaproteobacteria bacterium]
MPKFQVDEAMVRKLAELLDETGLTEIEYAVGDHTVRVARSGAATAVTAAPSTTAPSTPAPEPAGGPRRGAVTSPMVGVVYLSPEPGAELFIKTGDTVTEGQTLLLIEAMKTFNPVRAPRAGKVTQILIADKTPVEFGEELVIIE